MSAFKTFLMLYAFYADLDPSVFDGKFSADAVKKWNSYMFALSNKVKRLPSKEFVMMFKYAYVHDPLRYGDYRPYGTLSTYYKVASRYKAWRDANKIDIDKKGFNKVLFDTKPHGVTDLDMELLKELED